MKLTIDQRGHDIVARDEDGNVHARRKTYCNPAAIHQIMLDAEMLGAEIDWDNSQIARPTYTTEEINLASKLWDAASDDGTIQAGEMHEIAPHCRPELHTTTSIPDAFEALTGKSYDADFFIARFL